MQPVEDVMISPNGKFAITRVANEDIPKYEKPWDLVKEDKLWCVESGQTLLQVKQLLCKNIEFTIL